MLKTNAKWSVSPFWDASVMNKDTKQSRVMLTVNLNRKQFRITLGLRCTKDEFERAIQLKKGGGDLQRSIMDHVQKAEAILGRLPNPTKEEFVKLFKSQFDLKDSTRTSITPYYHIRIAELKKEKRFGTAHNLLAAYRAVLRYKLRLKGIDATKYDTIADLPDVDFYFEEIDSVFLKGFRSYLLDNGRSETTCSIYLAYLRAFYNHAVDAGILPERDAKAHPFYKIKITNAVRTKAVLYLPDIKKLWDYEPDGIREERAKAYWFLCYLMNGMNFQDLCYLKWKNVRGNILTFVRRKTKNTQRTQKEIQIYLHDELKALIEQYGNPPGGPDDFIFPLLNDCRDDVHRNDTMARHRSVFNKKLGPIGVKLGLDVHLCLNLARHSFATALKTSGTPTSFISDAMGHTSANTTDRYLKSLPEQNLREMTKGLMSFNTAG